MILIAHRGNIDGRNPDKENSPEYIDEAISKGYDVEVDVWYHPINKDYVWLGHDDIEYIVKDQWLLDRKDKLWIHCKNLLLVEKIMNTDLNWFWHEKDKVTITSKGYVWCFPGHEVDGGIMVEWKQKTDKKIIGVCSDNPRRWQK